MKSRSYIPRGFLLVPILGVACSSGLGQPATEICKPSPVGIEAAGAPEIRPGEYLLTLVATSGSKSGSSSQGNLWLWPTSARDRSPSTGELVGSDDTNSHPLYGATNLNFKRIGAPMDFAGRGSEPSPTSRDPVFPGVLVLRDSRETVLTIGTLSNIRDDGIRLDGSGIGLWVTESGPNSFFGEWRGWGVVEGGAGYFCSMPTNPADRADG